MATRGSLVLIRCLDSFISSLTALLVSLIGMSLTILSPGDARSGPTCQNKKLNPNQYCRVIDNQEIVRYRLTPLPGSSGKESDCDKLCKILKLE